MYNHLTVDRYLDIGDAIRFRVNEELALLVERTKKGYRINIDDREIEIPYKETK